MKIKLVLHCLVLTLFCINAWSVHTLFPIPQTEVKGISTQITIVPTVIPSVIPIFTPTSTLTPNKIIYPSPTVQSKQYGAWYWRKEINKSQVWLGTDATGKDIWSDGVPTPTAIPTQIPQHASTSSSMTTSAGTSVREIEEKIIRIR